MPRGRKPLINVPVYVYRNIESFGNSVLPKRLVKKHGVERLTGYISWKTKKTLHIREVADEQRGNYYIIEE